MSLEKYVLLDKKVGETPLETLETWRDTREDLKGVPMAYAGRLDPMASGQLLILIGEECKVQEKYHHLDKEYQVGILFGAHSDSGDVLGIITPHLTPIIEATELNNLLQGMVGTIEFPYPVFSAKTVQGKPLHTWTMENRLHEITIPTRKSEIYKLSLDNIKTFSRLEIAEAALAKVDLIPPVTDPRKALGNDFRRPEVRRAWQEFKAAGPEEDVFYLAEITCICSSGTYMRTLAEVIAEKINTKGLAFSIHRNIIGKYGKQEKNWLMKF